MQQNQNTTIQPSAEDVAARHLLTQYLNANTGNLPTDVDVTTLRYAIYARKSTLGDERQEKSLEQQIAECMERVVLPRKLNVVGEPIIEKGSAKESGIRPKFDALMRDIKDGKLDGIICWHPDRLSRNMKDAGEIIDLIDQGRLVDLQFATFNFENTPNGKMLLGITFVLSKAYSENLSTNVSRGNKRKLIDEGKYLGKLIHGYVITKDRKLQPDEHNFTLIQNAFQMRLEGATMPTISKYLNNNGYTSYWYGKGHQSYRWNKGKVEEMLKRTVYCGALWYGDNYIWLDEYYDFLPIISVPDFLKLHQADDLNSGIFKLQRASKEVVAADLFRKMIFCGECKKPMSSGITTKKKDGAVIKRRYYYRCETEACAFKGKSVRPKVVLDYMANFVREHQFTTEDNYASYLSSYDAKVSQKHSELGSEIRSLNKQLSDKQTELENTKALVADPTRATVAKYYTADLERLSDEIAALNKDLKVAKYERASLKTAAKSYADYLELHEKAPDLLLSKLPLATLDRIGRNFFLNLTIKDGAVSVSELKEPYAGFLKHGNFNHGRGERTRTFDLLLPKQAR